MHDNQLKEVKKAEEVEGLINRRRRQILVHSCIYYKFLDSLVDDATFDKWAGELVELQKKYPAVAKNCVYADAFKNFDGSTGFDLPYYRPEIVGVAEQLLRFVRGMDD
jgi:ribonucleotide reductase beta subunit family protein with ferritin-like domain